MCLGSGCANKVTHNVLFALDCSLNVMDWRIRGADLLCRQQHQQLPQLQVRAGLPGLRLKVCLRWKRLLKLAYLSNPRCPKELDALRQNVC